MISGREVFEQFCAFLDKVGYNYNTDEENMVIQYGVIGDDLPIDITAIVHDPAKCVVIQTKIPVVFGEEQQVEAILAATKANQNLAMGQFFYEKKSGKIVYMMSSIYLDCEISDEWFGSLVGFSSGVVDFYNDQFLMLARGYKSIEDFLQE